MTILFGGLHWRVERILQAVLENGGHRAQVLPVATRDDLLTGREVADIGQCPTSFTSGNLVNFLKKEVKATSAAEKFVYLTAQGVGRSSVTTLTLPRWFGKDAFRRARAGSGAVAG